MKRTQNEVLKNYLQINENEVFLQTFENTQDD